MSGVQVYRYGRVPEDLLLSTASDRACRLHALITRWPYLHPGETPKRRELAAALRCSADSVDRALRELEAGGWLMIHRHQDGGLHLPSEYELAENVRTGAEGGGRMGAATFTSRNDEMPGQGGRTGAARGGRMGAATIRAEELPEEEKPPPLPPRSRKRDSEQDRTSTDVILVFDAWRASTGKRRAQLDGKRRKLIGDALDLGYTVEELCLAVTGWSFSPHHRGENERRTVYNDLGLLLRDAGHIDTFLELAERRGSRLRPGRGNGAAANEVRHDPAARPGHDPAACGVCSPGTPAPPPPRDAYDDLHLAPPAARNGHATQY